MTVLSTTRQILTRRLDEQSSLRSKYESEHKDLIKKHHNLKQILEV